jgi:hypothetical protein
MNIANKRLAHLKFTHFLAKRFLCFFGKTFFFSCRWKGLVFLFRVSLAEGCVLALGKKGAVYPQNRYPRKLFLAITKKKKMGCDVLQIRLAFFEQ